MKHLKLFEQVEDWDDPFGEDFPDVVVEFKVGDKVKILNNDGMARLIIGSIGTIVKIRYGLGGIYYDVSGEQKNQRYHCSWCYSARQLEKVESLDEQYNWDDDPFEEDEKSTKLKIGDMVKILNNGSRTHLQIGSIGTISNVLGTKYMVVGKPDSYLKFVGMYKKELSYLYSADQLEKVGNINEEYRYMKFDYRERYDAKEEPTIFSKQFTEFLNDRGIYDEYIAEVGRQHLKNSNNLDDINAYIKKRINFGREYEEIDEIINNTLTWSNTKRGSRYWENINHAW